MQLQLQLQPQPEGQQEREDGRMAIGVTSDSTFAAGETAKRNFTVPLTLMVSLYFGIGFITALNDILIPHFKDLFHLTNVKALMVQLCFFGAYFVMSLPSGSIVGKIGYKRGIVVALTVMGIGLLLFLPASVIIFYPLFLFALFIVGSGLALLQVAINPYVGALGAPGGLGLMCLALHKARGGHSAVVVDIDPAKRDAAKKAGAVATIDGAAPDAIQQVIAHAPGRVTQPLCNRAQ